MEAIKSFINLSWSKSSKKKSKSAQFKTASRNTKISSTMPSKFTENYVNEHQAQFATRKYTQSLSMVDISHYSHTEATTTTRTVEGNSNFYVHPTLLNDLDTFSSSPSAPSFRRSSLQSSMGCPASRNCEQNMKEIIDIYQINAKRKISKRSRLAKSGRNLFSRKSSIEAKPTRRPSLLTLWRCQSLQYKPDDNLNGKLRRTSVNDALLRHCSQDLGPSPLKRIKTDVLHVFSNASLPSCGLYSFTMQLQLARKENSGRAINKYWKEEILHEGLEILKSLVVGKPMKVTLLALIETWRRLHQKILPTLLIMMESVKQNINAKFDVLHGFQNDVLPYAKLLDASHKIGIEENRQILVQMVLILSRNATIYNQYVAKPTQANSFGQRRTSLSSQCSYHRDSGGRKNQHERFERLLLVVLSPYLDEDHT